MYNTDENVFLSATNDSDKTICAEFAILRLFSKEISESKCVQTEEGESGTSRRANDAYYDFFVVYQGFLAKFSS